MKGVIPLCENEVFTILRVLALTRKANRNLALFTVGMETGFRITELLSLTISDVYKDGAVMDTVSVARKNMKRKREGRSLPLTRAAKQAIAELIQWLREEGYWQGTDYLFQSARRGNHAISRTQVWQIINDAARAGGISTRVGTHSMRKTFARRYRQWLIEQVAIHQRQLEPMREVQKALGHTSIESTEKYIEWDDNILIEYIRSR